LALSQGRILQRYRSTCVVPWFCWLLLGYSSLNIFSISQITMLTVVWCWIGRDHLVNANYWYRKWITGLLCERILFSPMI
jgi:hypothetical protein